MSPFLFDGINHTTINWIILMCNYKFYYSAKAKSIIFQSSERTIFLEPPIF